MILAVVIISSVLFVALTAIVMWADGFSEVWEATILAFTHQGDALSVAFWVLVLSLLASFGIGTAGMPR